MRRVWRSFEKSSILSRVLLRIPNHNPDLIDPTQSRNILTLDLVALKVVEIIADTSIPDPVASLIAETLAHPHTDREIARLAPLQGSLCPATPTRAVSTRGVGLENILVLPLGQDPAINVTERNPATNVPLNEVVPVTTENVQDIILLPKTEIASLTRERLMCTTIRTDISLFKITPTRSFGTERF